MPVLAAAYANVNSFQVGGDNLDLDKRPKLR